MRNGSTDPTVNFVFSSGLALFFGIMALAATLKGEYGTGWIFPMGKTIVTRKKNPFKFWIGIVVIVSVSLLLAMVSIRLYPT